MKQSLVRGSIRHFGYVGKEFYLNLTAWELSCCHSIALMFKYLLCKCSQSELVGFLH